MTQSSKYMIGLILRVDPDIVFNFITTLDWRPFMENAFWHFNLLKPLHQSVRLPASLSALASSEICWKNWFVKGFRNVLLFQQRKNAINNIQSAFISKSD